MNENDIFKIIQVQNINILAKILEQGVNPNIHMQSAPFWTPLQAAIDEIDDGGTIQIVQLLIQFGADVNAWNLLQDSNPLIMAIWGGHDQVTRLLLEAGANPNVKDSEGNSPLRFSVNQENVEVVKLLLKYGVQSTLDRAGGFGGMNALGIAVHKMNIPIIEILLDAGANPEVTDNDHRKPIERIPKDANTNIRIKIESLLSQK